MTGNEGKLLAWVHPEALLKAHNQTLGFYFYILSLSLDLFFKQYKPKHYQEVKSQVDNNENKHETLFYTKSLFSLNQKLTCLADF